MDLKVAALLPPSNIDRIIGRVQTEIFSRFGLTSSLALPVMIPLQFLPDTVSCGEFQGVFKDQRSAYPIKGVAYLQKEDALYAGVDFGQQGQVVRDELKVRLSNLAQAHLAREHRTAVTTIFPLADGFFLCQDSQVGESIIDALGPAPTLQFSSFTYALIRITVSDMQEKWWDEVYWEIEAELRARKRTVKS